MPDDPKKVELREACKKAIAAFGPAATASAKTKLAADYEREWQAELERRRGEAA